MAWDSEWLRSVNIMRIVSSVFNKLHGQPASYDKKCVFQSSVRWILAARSPLE